MKKAIRTPKLENTDHNTYFILRTKGGNPVILLGKPYSILDVENTPGAVLDISKKFGATTYAQYIAKKLPNALSFGQTAALLRAVAGNGNEWDLMRASTEYRNEFLKDAKMLQELERAKLILATDVWHHLDINSGTFLSAESLPSSFWETIGAKAEQPEFLIIGDPFTLINSSEGTNKLFNAPSVLKLQEASKPYIQAYVRDSAKFVTGDLQVMTRKPLAEFLNSNSPGRIVVFKNSDYSYLPEEVERPAFLQDDAPTILKTMNDAKLHGENTVYSAILHGCSSTMIHREELKQVYRDFSPSTRLTDLFKNSDFGNSTLGDFLAKAWTFTYPKNSPFKAMMFTNLNWENRVWFDPDEAWKTALLYRVITCVEKEVWMSNGR
jgi:hypothetical protein